MRNYFLLCCLAACSFHAAAQSSANGYRTLDPSDPVVFEGSHIVYGGRKITLDENAFFLDGGLSDAVAERYPYVFNTIQKAVAALSDGTETQPMTLYIAPWVYWVDDPDDPEIRKPKGEGRTPFGMEIDCEWLRFEGLTQDPRNVVLACNRGQTHGAEGNFTLFNIRGDGLSAENVTFGNYCNIDLEFPLKPELNRARRADAIVQAQLIFSNADRAWAKNTRFLSRLNLGPFWGAKRVLFHQCHFECTDDALCGTAVHLDCTFDLYSSKPFGSTYGTGAVFLNCDLRVITNAGGDGRVQYINKVGNQVALVDTRFHAENDNLYLGWTGNPADHLRCYQYQVTLNGKPVFMESKHPSITVDMTGEKVLDAYRIEYEGDVVYNTYNLLRGDDGWDPMGVKEIVLAAEKASGKNYTDVSTYLKVTPVSGKIESGADAILLETTILRFGNYPAGEERLTWNVSPGETSAVSLLPSGDALSCEVAGTNNDDETHVVNVMASTASGLESASVLTVLPEYLPAPPFTKSPEIQFSGKGQLNVSYELELGHRADHSLITWYRCSDAAGKDPVEVAVSRLDEPKRTYTLSPGDAGHYIRAAVAPRHIRSHPGEIRAAVTDRPVSVSDVAEKNISTDFRDFPTAWQPEVLPGTWTVDCFKPADTDYYDWTPVTGEDAWIYRAGMEGAAGRYGLTQAHKGARLLYTPVDGSYGDMSVEIRAAPAKTAGQGFGSATGQYMDIFIKYDTRTLSGYGLRIVRTPKYGDAVDFILMKYENGVSYALTEPVTSDVYRGTVKIRVDVRGDKLAARVTSDAPLRSPRPGVVPDVRLEVPVDPAAFGGMGLQHTGTTWSGGTWLRYMSVVWK